MADSGIYEIVNLVNGKRYIGSAKCFTVRWRAHRTKLRNGTHSNRYLQAAWAKHGESAFDFRRIVLCEVGELIAAEQRVIDERRPEYNLSPTAGSTLGVRFADEAKRKIGAALKGKTLGRKRDRGAVEKTAAAHRGRKRSAETRARLAAKAAGRKMPPRSEEHRRKLSEAMRGKSKSPEHAAAFQAGRRVTVDSAETRAAKSEALRRDYAEGRRSRERPPEYREKIAASLRGRKATAEHRANQAAAQLGKKRGPYKTRRMISD